MVSRRARIAVVLAAWLLTAAVSRGDEQLLFDFERSALSADWSAVRQITVAREAVPASAEKDGLVPAGRGAHVTTQGNAGLFAKSGKVPRDWRAFESVSMWVYRSPEEANSRPTSTIEIQVFENDGRTKFWRKVELGHTGWTKVSLPLRWFRFGGPHIPRWDRIDRFGIWFRDAAEVTVDAMAVADEEVEIGSELTAADLVAVAFPDTPAGEVRVKTTERVRVVTNAAKLDVEQLAGHLADLAGRVSRNVPLLAHPATPATLLVFATPEQYRAFFPRFARKMNSEGPVPASPGFTMHGISASYWDDRFGTLRPVYTHEFVHSLLTHGVLLDNHGEWFQEGLATYYQIQFHPQPGLSRIVTEGLEKESFRLPLPQLLSGRVIPTNRYWQALTVIEMLLGDEGYRTRFPGLVSAFQQAGATDLGPQLQPVLNTPWDEFTRRWQDHCRRRYQSAAGGRLSPP